MQFLSSVSILILIYGFLKCYVAEDLPVSYNPAELLSNVFGTKLAHLIENEDPTKFGKEVHLDYIDKPRQRDVFDQERPLIFENTEQNSEYDIPEFQDQNKKKRRRRPRKPKNQHLSGSGDLVHQGPSSFGAHPYGNPTFLGDHQPYYRPSSFQKPSVASEALRAIASALTSIALYDDKQCVPRLLCEAAGGGNLTSTSLVQPIASLQPLFTLLSAYSGISTSPLFIFGRAVFLGMTSKRNPGTCRYAYPQCPTDPEQLVHYLNNHNGGFFRFFNAPQGQQNVDQFYNQLSESYGLYHPNLHQNIYHNAQSNNGYGLYQPDQQNKDRFRLQDQGYGLYEPNALNNQQTYSSTYKHDKFRFESDNNFEKRILNSPSNNFLDADIDDEYRDTTLSFPDNNDFYKQDSNIRDNRKLKFPDEAFNTVGSSYQNIYNAYENHDYNRRGKTIIFPDGDKSKRYTNKNKNINTYKTNINVNDYIFDYEHNFYVKKMSDDDNLRTVYVVRGNGDPNYPEIVKVKPGESIS